MPRPGPGGRVPPPGRRCIRRLRPVASPPMTPCSAAHDRDRRGVPPGRPRDPQPARRSARRAVGRGLRADRGTGEPRAAAGPDRSRHQAPPAHRRRRPRPARPAPGLGEVSAEHGAAIIAASTHPFALWWEQVHERGRPLQDAGRGSGGGRPAHGHLRHARPRRHRGPGAAHRPDEPGHLLPPPPAGAVDLLAVLGRVTTPG
jgi:hypothetical protein